MGLSADYFVREIMFIKTTPLTLVIILEQHQVFAPTPQQFNYKQLAQETKHVATEAVQTIQPLAL